MLHRSHWRDLRRAVLFVLLLALGLVAARLALSWPARSVIDNYLPLHTMLEVIAVVISVLVFASGWNAYSRSLPRNAVILACAFLGVAVLDLSHALSFPGMPGVLGSAGPDQTIYFWLSARLLAAVALLGVSLLDPRPLVRPWARYAWLAAVVVLVGGIHALISSQGSVLPDMYDAVAGMRPLKIHIEYAVMFINVLTAGVLWLRMREPQSFNAAALFGAVCGMAMSEGLFTLYIQMNDAYNLLGHLYKAAAYLMLYRAVFVEVIEQPYRELAHVRNQLSATLEAVPDPMLEIDMRGVFQAVHSSHPITVPRPTEELIGATLEEVLHKESAQVVRGALSQAYENGTSSGAQLSIDVPQPGGRGSNQRWFELSVSRKGAAQGEDTRFIVLSRDITERKQAEALVREQEANRQASREKSQFLSRVSHELRTPLNAIIGFAQLLLFGGNARLPSAQRLHAEYILRAGQHLLDMINDILDLTRVESGEAEITIEPAHLSTLLSDSLPMILPQAEARGVAIHAEEALADDHNVLVDPRRFKQVLLNVLSNAVKYNHAGGKVVVRCEQHPSVPGQIALLVEDTGKGLTAEQQKGLFQPFNRLGADQSGIEGTGLGLVISRRLMETMSGSIDLSSAPGKGTTVMLRMSLAASDAMPETASAGHGAGSAEDTIERQEATVLCIEDNPLNAALLRAIFDLRPALTLLIEEDGARGLERLKRIQPDLVLIDINLPDMNGADVLHKLRQMPQHGDMVCIAMSADVSGDPVARSKEQGFADFWPKPLDVDGLLLRLDAVVSSICMSKKARQSRHAEVA